LSAVVLPRGNCCFLTGCEPCDNLETFDEEDPVVQLQLLTAVVKCFLKNPENTQEMVQTVLDKATEESDNPDLRDRGFIYWRLLSTDPEAAKMVVLGDKPVIEDDTFKLDPVLLNSLIGQIATLSSIYHKPPEAFVVRRNAGSGVGGSDGRSNDDDDDDEDDDEADYDQDHADGGGAASGRDVDLLDMAGLSVGAGPGSASPAQSAQGPPLVNVCSAEKSGGLEISARFRQVNRKIRMELRIYNDSAPADVTALAVQLNKNAFGLSPSSQQIICNPPIVTGATGHANVDLVTTPNMLAPVPVGTGQPASSQVQVAIKNMQTGTVFYFAVQFNFEALFSPNGTMERSTFIEAWKSIDDRNELFGTVTDLKRESVDIDLVTQKFAQYHVFFIARRPVPNVEGQEVVYFSMRTVTGMEFLAELTFKQGLNACKVCLKSEHAAYGPLAKKALEDILGF
jgi:AP-1 complex subunit beta-1